MNDRAAPSIYAWQEVVQFARRNSSYYRELYRYLPDSIFSIEQLPIIDSGSFWEANSLDHNQVLTTADGNFPLDGVVFKSGGTTGSPKFSVFNKLEWETFTKEFGRNLAELELESGDRVGNLFYAGELYASFLFITKSIENSERSLLHFPLAGHSTLESNLKTIGDLGINVLAGVPTSIVSYATFILQNPDDDRVKKASQKVKKILFGGEGLFEDQFYLLLRAFPNLEIINSIGYASVDAGHLGLSYNRNVNLKKERVFNPGLYSTHRVFKPSSIVEIVDQDSGEVIRVPGKTGRLIYTNLARTVMPIIRYPVGDMAKWIIPGEEFVIKGRSGEGVRLGPVSILLEELRSVLFSASVQKFLGQNSILGQQWIVDRGLNPYTHISSDSLMLKLALTAKLASEGRNQLEGLLRQELHQSRSMFKECVSKGLISDLALDLCTFEELEKNPRTGKMKMIIDRRF